MFRVAMILLALTTLGATFGTTSAFAGPWPRAQGEGFLSFSLDYDTTARNNHFASVYFEYGLSGNRTLVIDRQQSGDELTKTFVALRFPLGAPDRALKLAYDVGLGAVDDHVALRAGFSLGRGWSMGQDITDRPFKWMGKWSGWWSVDTRTLVFHTGIDGRFEADFTLGIQVTERIKSVSQLQTGAPFRNDPYAKLAQSLVYEASEGRHYILGVTSGIYDNDDLMVNLGLWQNF